ncbi:PucR family transcriptional regulator [Arthrobacter sp. M4]|uniref:PucR family transcriptional regulator n=1 Tax=Arthrobacter sp. M4 TaxID=218160 RepID=UPI001CDC33AF|nr:PucR family transcriptional regulator [Arthrobacter sp. M4]MCA4133491.1 PucR family transcriptional regulator [Arthrobacter sp. M4]
MAVTAEPEAGRLGFVTLDQFLAQLPPQLEVLHDGGSGDVPLRWVEPSELEDPTPYLLDGELILTAGLPFQGAAGTAARVSEYVRRLVSAKVAALGFGIQPYFEAVPEALVSACREHNLTLLLVPPSLPFAAIGLEFSRLLESDNARVFRQLADANRQLMRAVLSSRPEHELLATLVQRVPVWAAAYGADGKVRARAHSPNGGGTAQRAGSAPAAGHEGMARLLERLLAGSGPRLEMDSFNEPGSAVVVGHPLRSNRDATLGALVLGSGKPLTAAQNNMVSTAVGLLELLARQRTSGSLAPSQLATSLLLNPDVLSSGAARELSGLKDLLAQAAGAGRTASLRVIQGVRAADSLESGDSPVREVLQWRRLFDTKLVALTDYGFAAITRLKVDEGLLAEVERLGWRLVVGDPTELTGLTAAAQRATALRSRVLASGASIRVEEAAWSVTGLLGPEAGALLAERVLQPLLSLPAERRTALMGVLRGWLAENGSWDASAKALGLHRNSVRRQIGVIGELLDADLNSAQVRAELWIALQYTETEGAAQEPQRPQAR